MQQLDLKIWQDINTEAFADLVAAAALCKLGDVQAISRLRQRWDADYVTAALSLGQARTKAQLKWPDHAATLMADSVGVEQATSERVGMYKAARFAKLGRPVVDLCCGIGGDAMALGKQVVLAVDRDPVRAWMTQRNVGCPAVATDLKNLLLENFPVGSKGTEDKLPGGFENPLDKLPGGVVFHIDPARRNSHGRTHHYADYQPGPLEIEALLEKWPTGAIKLGPGVDREELPPGELEWISDSGRLVQAVLWTGELAGPSRRATCLPAGLSLAGEPDTPPGGPIQRYVMTFDASVERAELIGRLCQELDVRCLHPRIGLLSSETLVTSPWVTCFEVLDVGPWRLKRVRDCLKAHDGGLVEIKTRDRVVDPDQLQKKLRGKGSARLTVFILRWGDKVRAIVAQRMKSGQPAKK